MKRVNISIPDEMKAQTDILLQEGIYASFSDVVRIGLRHMLEDLNNRRIIREQERRLLQIAEEDEFLKEARKKPTI